MAERNFKWERAVDAEVAGVALAEVGQPLDAVRPASARQLWRLVWILMSLRCLPCRLALRRLLLRAHKEEEAVGAAVEAGKLQTPVRLFRLLVRRGGGAISWLHGTP